MFAVSHRHLPFVSSSPLTHTITKYMMTQEVHLLDCTSRALVVCCWATCDSKWNRDSAPVIAPYITLAYGLASVGVLITPYTYNNQVYDDIGGAFDGLHLLKISCILLGSMRLEMESRFRCSLGLSHYIGIRARLRVCPHHPLHIQ